MGMLLIVFHDVITWHLVVDVNKGDAFHVACSMNESTNPPLLLLEDGGRPDQSVSQHSCLPSMTVASSIIYCNLYFSDLLRLIKNHEILIVASRRL